MLLALPQGSSRKQQAGVGVVICRANSLTLQVDLPERRQRGLLALTKTHAIGKLAILPCNHYTATLRKLKYNREPVIKSLKITNITVLVSLPAAQARALQMKLSIRVLQNNSGYEQQNKTYSTGRS